MNTARRRGEKFHRFVNNPYVQGIVGFILLVSVLTELFGLHHGLFALGLWHTAQLTPNALQALERIGKWLRKLK